MESAPGHLELLGPLGSGSEKQVYLARNRRTGERVAAARIECTSVEREALRTAMRLQRSARDSFIAPLSECIERDTECWVVGEYFPGGDLATYLERHSGDGLPLLDALRIGARVAAALSHAHAMGFVHGDVKPANVLIDGSGEAFLSDFGLAAPIETASGTARGTAGYMAPEIARGLAATPASDIYGLACLLYELLAGVGPFAASEVAETLRRQAVGDWTPIEVVYPAASRLVSRMLARMLSLEPARRPASARDVELSLKGIAAQSYVFATAGAVHVQRPGARRRIDDAIQAVASGGGVSIVVMGAAGSGKSLLLERMHEQATTAGMLTLRTSSAPDLRRPNGVLGGLLRPMMSWLDALEPHHASLLRELTSKVEEGNERRVDGERRNDLIRAVAAGLKEWSGEGLALFVDDLHYADEDSLAVLNGLAAAARDGELPGLLIAGSQSSEAGSPTLRASLELELSPFDENDMYEFLVAARVDPLDDSIVRSFVDASDGIPLRARMLLDDSRRTAHEHTPLSMRGESSVRNDVLVRFSSLSRDARRALEWGACIGSAFTGALVDEISGKHTSDSAWAEIDDCGLVGPHCGGLRFLHAMAWQTVHEAITTHSRERMHEALAAWAAEQGPGRLDDGPIVVAHHLALAGPSVSFDVLAKSLNEAGEYAFRQRAWRSAARLFDAALAEIAGAENAPLGWQAELHRWVGVSHFYCYDASERCLEELDTAQQLFKRAGDDIGFVTTLRDRVRAAGQSGVNPYGTHDPRLDELASASERVALDPSSRAQIWITIAEGNWTAARGEAAHNYALRALDIASRHGDDRQSGEACFIAACASLQMHRLDESLSYFRQALGYGERADDPALSRRAMSRMPVPLLASGRAREALEVLSELQTSDTVAISEDGDVGDFAVVRSFSVLSAAALGDYAGAIERAQSASRLVDRLDYIWPRLTLYPAAVYAHVMHRDVVGARALLERLVRPGDVLVDPSVMEPTARRLGALIHFFCGDPLPDPIDVADDAWPQADEAIDLPHAFAAGLHVELADAADRPVNPAAARVLGVAEERGAKLTIPWPFVIPRARGVAALRAGELDEAEAHLRRAIEVTQKIGSPLETARSRYDLARVLVRRGSRLAFHDARGELERAIETFRGQGPMGFLERAERLCDHAISRSR